MTADNTFQIARTFDAPVERVWDAWSSDDALKQWFGPKGCPITQSSMHFHAGGHYHYGIQMPDGSELWGRWTFLEITPPERINFAFSFSDATGEQITRHPYAPNWPLEMMSVVMFRTVEGDRTELRLESRAWNATDIEQQVLNSSHASIANGWNAVFDQLADYLKKPV